MSLLTKTIEKRIPKLRTTDGKAAEERKVYASFFNPCGSGTWYALEGERKGEDFIFFGLVERNGEKELGYFSLNELESIRLPFGLKIERDRYLIKGATLADAMAGRA